MLAIISIACYIQEYAIEISLHIKNHRCYKQWWKTESHHKKNNGIIKVQFIQKAEIVSWNPIYRWNPENSQNKMVLSVLLGMRDAFEPGVTNKQKFFKPYIIKPSTNLSKRELDFFKLWPPPWRHELIDLEY